MLINLCRLPVSEGSHKDIVNNFLNDFFHQGFFYRAEFNRTVEISMFIERMCKAIGRIHIVGKIDFNGIDWAIVGGESGWHARPMLESWVLGIKEQCDVQGVSFFFKQWGGTNKKKSGRVLLGQTWDDMPERMSS